MSILLNSGPRLADTARNAELRLMIDGLAGWPGEGTTMICNTAFLEGLEKAFFDLQDSGGETRKLFSPQGCTSGGEKRCQRLTDQCHWAMRDVGTAIQLRRRGWGGTLPRLA